MDDVEEEEDIHMEMSVSLKLCLHKLHSCMQYSKAEEAELRAAVRCEEERWTRFKNLFESCKFFLSREVPREALTFSIRYAFRAYCTVTRTHTHTH